MITLKYGSNVLALPGDVMNELKNSTKNDLAVIMSICSGITDEEALCNALGIGEEDLSRALSFWRDAGVIEGSGAMSRRITPSDGEAMVYTGQEIAEISENDSSIDSLINKCRDIIGMHAFTHAEASSVVYMRHGLGLDPEYIMLLCSHYAKTDRVTLRLIEKKATELYDSGIRTVGALENYLAADKKRYDAEYKIRKLFGLGERALLPREQAYIKDWVVKWGMSDEMIRRAYEETIVNTKTPTLAYANAILKSWHESGVMNEESAEKAKTEHKKKTAKKAQSAAPGFDLDEFFDLAIARGQGNDGKKGE